jgi:sugar phosphate isomerase/epimerase
MRLGYNTNGLANHELLAAINLLAEIGYQSVAITIDHRALSPLDDWRSQAMRVKAALDGNGMRSVIETGARFLLDSWTKHEPTLVTADAHGRARRLDFYRHAVDVAQLLGSDCVSIWSGVVRDAEVADGVWRRLGDGLNRLCEYAGERGVSVGFEPEPGMFVDTMARFEQLLERVDSPCLRLTLDVGHLHCLGEVPIADQIRKWAPRLTNIHIEDMHAGVHEHRMFGEGEIDFRPVIAALREIDYRGGIHVELSRHSHDGPNAARKAFEFLSGSGFPA